MKITTSLTKAFASGMLILTCSLMSATAATIVVTNADDSGPGSLRAALAQANSNAQADTINFDPEFFATARTIVLASELQITSDNANPGRPVTINGPGANLLTISGNNAVRPFYADVYSSLAMSGITVRDGNGTGTLIPGGENSGGGILCNVCSLTLTNMVIRNNTTSNRGGGIFAAAPTTFSVLNSVITENNANNGGGIWEQGGNLKVIRNTTISNNVARNNVGGANFDYERVTIENCVVTGNRAATIPDVAGGAGGLRFFQTNGTVTDTVVSNNLAGFDSAGNPIFGISGREAGISANGAVGGPMTFRRVTVSGNRVSGEGGTGPGMVLRSGGSDGIIVIDSLISGNQGGNEGGGIYPSGQGPISVINTTIANNEARGGGGIYNFCENLTIINSTIAGNRAGPATANTETGGGGGILNRATPGSHTRIQNSIIANNTQEDVRGPFISNGYNIVGSTTLSTGFGATGDQLNVNPLLDPNGLQNNGGPTLTIALQETSPAINAGSNTLAVDQNGAAPPSINAAIPSSGYSVAQWISARLRSSRRPTPRPATT